MQNAVYVCAMIFVVLYEDTYKIGYTVCNVWKAFLDLLL